MAEPLVGHISLRFEILGDVQFHRRLEGVLGNAENLSPALVKIGDSFREHMRSVFATGGMATAAHWPALTADYARWKNKHYPGRPILTLSGDLGRSMAEEGAEGNIARVSGNELTVGSGLKVGAWYLGTLHQTGTKNMARRRIIALPDHIRTEWTHILADHVNLEG